MYLVKLCREQAPDTPDAEVIGFWPALVHRDKALLMFSFLAIVFFARTCGFYVICYAALDSISVEGNLRFRSSSQDTQSTLLDRENDLQHEVEKEVKFMTYRNNKVLPTIKESYTESADFKMTYVQAGVGHPIDESAPGQSQAFSYGKRCQDEDFASYQD